ncbi:hypothetical protein JW826_03825 [Candidatus Woesearchaeota archaeon]|nr:hypothetical protein [Candidatus Woesearchaeota archaeon]
MLIWNHHVKPYEELLLDVRSRFEKANSIFLRQIGYAPIETIKHRIKSEESARRKLSKKGLGFDEKSLKQLSDLAGMRVICKFTEDIPEVLGLIKSWSKPKFSAVGGAIVSDQIDIVEEQDFIREPKPSGYRSYHVICQRNGLVFEVQVRTIAMDFWASTEHMLKYKYKGDIPKDVREKLKSIADIAGTLDMAMDDIRQDVNLGTAKSRLLDQFYKALDILENSGLAFKAENYKEQLKRVHNDLEALKSLAIQAKEDVPPGYWRTS